MFFVIRPLTYLLIIYTSLHVPRQPTFAPPPRVVSKRVQVVLRGVAGGAMGYVMGFAVVESVIRYVYDRPFSPQTDIPQIKGLLQLVIGPVGSLIYVLTPAALILSAAVLYGIGHGFLHLLTIWRPFYPRAPEERQIHRLGLTLFSLYTALTLLMSARIVPDFAPHPYRPTATAIAPIYTSPLYLSIVPQALIAFRPPERLYTRPIDVFAPLPPSPSLLLSDLAPTSYLALPLHPIPRQEPKYAMPGFRDRDIHIFMVESYGYVTVTNEEVAHVLAPVREDFEATLRGIGYDIVSDYLTSPVVGGFSWLAEATLLTGQWIDSQRSFTALYGKNLPTLSSALYDVGYHTFTVRPGTIHDSWPEGWDLYRFKHALVAHDGDFGYQGPWFSYVAVTDQFALWKANHYITARTAPSHTAYGGPLFAYYQLVSSHTPFSKIPPVVKRWDLLQDGRLYNDEAYAPLKFANSWSGGTELVEGYRASIAYVMETIQAYVTEVLDLSNDPIFIVLGDHQPQRPIREIDATWSVPIHIISRDQALLYAFKQRGFTDGMVGTTPPPHRPMGDFFPLFLEIGRTDGKSAGGGTLLSARGAPTH